MKMDMNLIRDLLIYFEENLNEDEEFEIASNIKIPGYTSEQIMYHVPLLIDGGYINYENDKARGRPTDYWIYRLTIYGHQFLELIRNDTIWKNIKEKLEKVGLAALPIIFTMIEPYIKQLLGIP